MTDIAVGIVGAGERGTSRGGTLSASPGAMLSGVADPDQKRVAHFVERFGCRNFASTPALLEASEVVCVATPTRDHFLIAREAIRRGKHVFLEWPPATSIGEAQTLARQAEEAGVLLGVSCPMLVHTELSDIQRDGSSPLVHLLCTYGAGADGTVNWPHELAEALALGTWLTRARASVGMQAQAVRSPLPALRAVAFGLRLQNGGLVQALLQQVDGEHPTTKTVYLPGTRESRRIELLTEAEPGAASDNTIEALLDREFRRFLSAVRQRRTTSPLLFSIAEAIPVMHLLERLLGKLR